jgi:acyl-CoA thioesterase-1
VRNPKHILFAVLIGLATTAQAQVIKIACIGNSITAGGYPQKVGALLGARYSVENDGVSGTTLLKKGDNPYWTKGKLANVFALKPSIITIKLGTNDSKPQNWKYKAEFETDLRALIDTLEKHITPKPVVWLCLPVPAWPVNGANAFGIDGQIIANEVIPIIKKVAADRQLNVIDLHTALLGMQTHSPDGVHPDGVGQDSIAANIYRALTKAATTAEDFSARVFPELYLRGRELKVDIPGAVPARLQVMDLKGRVLEAWSIPAGESFVHSLPASASGTYLVTIESKSGRAAKRLELP